MKKLIAICFTLSFLLLSTAAFAEDGIVSFNNASAQEIMAIEDVDIPEDIANAIVKYREAHGAFKSADDMVNVPGMTQDFLEELNPQVIDGDVVFDPDAEPALAPSKC